MFVYLQASVTYNEYMTTFHPCQNENLYTHNNWTLSDEFVDLVKSNGFYAEHVRWNIPRFRPSEVNIDGATCENLTSDDASEEFSQQQSHIEEDTITTNWPMSLRSKRKATVDEVLDDQQTCTQTRKLRRN